MSIAYLFQSATLGAWWDPGIDEEELSHMAQMATRAVVVFVVSLLYIRIAGMRTFGQQSPFDHLTALMLGAIMGKGVVTLNEPLIGFLVAGAVIMLLHWLCARLSHASRKAGRILKGSRVPLIQNGVLDIHTLRSTGLTEADILEHLRLNGKHVEIDLVSEAWLERSGKISFRLKS